MNVCPMCTASKRTEEGVVLDQLKLELQVLVSHSIGVLKIELRSSRRINVLKHRVISLGQNTISLVKTRLIWPVVNIYQCSPGSLLGYADGNPGHV